VVFYKAPLKLGPLYTGKVEKLEQMSILIGGEIFNLRKLFHANPLYTQASNLRASMCYRV
jgi:hypothetical protein